MRRCAVGDGDVLLCIHGDAGSGTEGAEMDQAKLLASWREAQNVTAVQIKPPRIAVEADADNDDVPIGRDRDAARRIDHIGDAPAREQLSGRGELAEDDVLPDLLAELLPEIDVSLPV